MPEQTINQTQSGGLTQLIEQMFPGLAEQIRGMVGGGADTGALHGVGDEFMNLVQQLYGGPNQTQQGGLDTLKAAQDMGNIQNAYKGYYGAIAAPTIQNNAIAGGLGAGAAAEAQGLAGAQAGVDLSKLQNAAQQKYGSAQIDVGGGLTKDILSALTGAGGVYSNEGQLQNQARGQDFGALGNMMQSILGYRPPNLSQNTQYPAFPTTAQGWIDLIKGGSGLYQPLATAIQKLYGAPPSPDNPVPTTQYPGGPIGPDPFNAPVSVPATPDVPDYMTPFI